MALEELFFNSFLLGEGVVVLKEWIFNSFILWEGVVVLKKKHF